MIKGNSLFSRIFVKLLLIGIFCAIVTTVAAFAQEKSVTLVSSGTF